MSVDALAANRCHHRLKATVARGEELAAFGHLADEMRARRPSVRAVLVAARRESMCAPLVATLRLDPAIAPHISPLRRS